MQVIRRDGTRQPFDIKRIHSAVDKAFRDVRKESIPEPLKEILRERFLGLSDDHVFSVEEIQDTVETTLMAEHHYDVAKGYILYREEHRNQRFLKERSDYMDRYRESVENAASSSETDANANVTVKNVANLNAEVYKTTNRQIQRYNMRKKLKELFPQYEAQYTCDLEHHIIYQHDEASYPTAINYCEAVSLWPFVQEGTSGLDGLGAGAPRHLSSFAGQFGNLVFLLTAQCKGAVAFGEFFNVFDHYAALDYGEDYHERLDEVMSERPRRTIGQAIDQYFQQIVFYINQPAGNRSFQSPFTNLSYYDSNYWHALFDGVTFPDGTAPSWERVSFLQKRFMRWLNRERTRTMLTFPVETMALLSDGKDIKDKEYKEFTAQMYAEGHSFFTYISDNPNAIASCCRLRSEIQENVFSFTNGLTGVQTGSVNVITLNISRIIQDWARENLYTRGFLQDHFRAHEDSFRDYLVDILERVYAYHIAYKTLVYENEKAGLLTASNAGYISMRKLYSTVGVNGINEAAEFIGLQCRDNEDYRHFCRLVTGTISEQNRAHSTDPRFLFNQEFVPAEGLSSKNCNWDREDGYWVPEGRILYNSYFYKADDPETSVLEKFRLHGRGFTELLDGGVGLHCNLEEHLSREQYLHLIDYAIENGTSYFTFNVPNSECINPDCHHIVKLPLGKCPKCGAPMRQWTRIIGYLRPVTDFDRYRKAEAEERIYHDKKI